MIYYSLVMNRISPTGFWIENDPEDHVFIPTLSFELNNFVKNKGITTVYDFGCGTGEYLQKLIESNPLIKATGFEGHQTSAIFNNILRQDLSKPISVEPADLVLSIEVGEHIPKQFEQTFINNLSNSAKKYLIISWAVEGQWGLGHVNCRNNEYVINQLELKNWVFDSETTKNMRNAIENTQDPGRHWIINTLMVFYR